MKIILITIAILSLAITSCASFTDKKLVRNPSGMGDGNTRGTGNIGNGGGACVCREPSNKSKITSATLVDFIYVKEKSLGKVEVKKSNEKNYEDLLKTIYEDERLPKLGRDLIKKEIESLKIDVYGSTSIKLRETIDSQMEVDCALALKDESCNYEQVATYTDEGFLRIKKDIFDSFSETDKAGLKLHEALYKMDRDWTDALWADQTRERVGYYFAGQAEYISEFLNDYSPSYHILNDRDSISFIKRGQRLNLYMKIIGDYYLLDNNQQKIVGEYFDSTDKKIRHQCSLMYENENWSGRLVYLRGISFNVISNKKADNFQERTIKLATIDAKERNLPPYWVIKCEYGDSTNSQKKLSTTTLSELKTALKNFTISVGN